MFNRETRRKQKALTYAGPSSSTVELTLRLRFPFPLPFDGSLLHLSCQSECSSASAIFAAPKKPPAPGLVHFHPTKRAYFVIFGFDALKMVPRMPLSLKNAQSLRVVWEKLTGTDRRDFLHTPDWGLATAQIAGYPQFIHAIWGQEIA
jgi:hypothetical protein